MSRDLQVVYWDTLNNENMKTSVKCLRWGECYPTETASVGTDLGAKKSGEFYISKILTASTGCSWFMLE